MDYYDLLYDCSPKQLYFGAGLAGIVKKTAGYFSPHSFSVMADSPMEPALYPYLGMALDVDSLLSFYPEILDSPEFEEGKIEDFSEAVRKLQEMILSSGEELAEARPDDPGFTPSERRVFKAVQAERRQTTC